MDQVESGNLASAPSGHRPFLFGNGPAQESVPQHGRSVSILSSLDKTGGHPSPLAKTTIPAWITIAVGLLLGITIGAAIVMSLSKDIGIGPLPPLASAGAVPEGPAATAAAAPPLGDERSFLAQPAVIAPAVIENVLPPETASSAPREEKPAPIATAAVPDSKAATKPDPVTDRPAPASAREAKTVSEQLPAPANVETKRESGKVATSTKKPSPAINETKAKQHKTAPDSVDKDASLLAALAAYGDGQPAKGIADVDAASGRPAASGAAKARPTPAQAASSQFDPKRDVVLRESNTTTGELVRRCKALGFFEGLLCRIRVCSNHWGKDPACPQSAAPAQDTN